ncbi:MAG: Endoribonuclease [Phenylobacterium sp.]|jgi:enamine deaminase RidA (YjgF/YER057c/UK114 family)|nr:Endoribonuclease [Phenylobacterium sp.]
MRLLVLSAVAGLALASAAPAQNLHIGAPTAAIASAVVAPAGSDTIYVSGMTPPPLNAGAPAGTPPEYGDTNTQTIGVLKRLDETLKSQGYGFGDVVMMRVYLVGDPAKGGKMDFPGMMAAYTQTFGTPAQPNKPARVTVQVASLVGPGMLVEIEVQAAKPHR